jgi:Zn-dependent peptidase ImmA (M78 family)
MYFYSYLEDYIKNLYISLSIIKPTQMDMMKIAQKLGVKVYFFDEQSEATYFGGIYRIFLNNQLSYKQQWQDFGHELCHVLLHAGNQSSLPKDFILYQEVKANNFMYHFCVPTFMLEKLSLPESKIEAANYISETFNVEFDFAVKRLNSWLSKRDSFIFYKGLKEVIRCE